MPLATSAKNTMLDAITIATISLHSAYSPAGATEVMGGTPPYARLPVVFAPAVSGVRFLAGAPYIFDVPAVTVAWIGMWDLAAAFIGMAPNGGGPVRPFVVSNAPGGLLDSVAHGLVAGMSVVVWRGSGALLPGGLYEGIVYYVLAATADAIQLSDTLGGLPLGLSTTGGGYVQTITPVIFTAQSTFTVNALALDATVVG